MPIGIHVRRTDNSLSKQLPVDIDEMHKFSDDICIQIFATGPQDHHLLVDSDDESIMLKINNDGIPIVIHGAYIDNIWNLHHRAIHNVRKELRLAARTKCTGVIVHLAKNSVENIRAITKVATGLVLEHPTVLWLEINVAKSSPNTFETPAKLGALFAAVRKLKITTPNFTVGLCVDTAHLFSCGMNIASYDAAKIWLEETLKLVNGTGSDIPLMFHINDSASGFNSGIDRHDVLGKGNLYADYADDLSRAGFAYFLAYAEEHNIVAILERKHEYVFIDMAAIEGIGYFKKTESNVDNI